MHQTLLHRKSLYFARCLGSGIKETNGSKISLENVDLDAFEVFVKRIYAGNVMIEHNAIEADIVIKTYYLADGFCMELGNDYVDWFKRHFQIHHF